MEAALVLLEDYKAQPLSPVLDVTDQVVSGSTALLSSGGCYALKIELIKIIEGLFAV